jgi:TOBE-like domain
MAVGPMVKIELATEAGTAVHVEMPQERYRYPAMRQGDEVFVRVKDMRVFPGHHNGLGHEWH